MSKQRKTGNILLILTALIWGTAFVFQRVGMESIEPITFNAARSVLAFVSVGAVALILNKKKGKPDVPQAEVRKKRANTLLGGVCCGAFLTAATMFQQIGVTQTTAGKAGFLTSMYMLFVPVVNLLLFRKKSTARVWIAVLIGVAGMYLLCVKDGFSFAQGDMWIMLCAVMFSGHILCCDYFVQKSDPVALSALQFLTAAVCSGVIAFFTETPTVEKLVSALIPILYCGIVSSGVGYTCQIVAQKFTDPTVASLILSLESVFAVLAGVLILGERMNAQEIIGCAVLFAAILLVQIPLSEIGIFRLKRKQPCDIIRSAKE